MQVSPAQLYFYPPGRSERVRPRVFFTLKFLAAFALLAAFCGVIVAVGRIKIAMAWPLPLSAAGLAGIIAGIKKRGRFSADFIIPSVAFLLLSLFFCLFSFGIIPMRLKDFLVTYWALILLTSFVLALVAFFYSRKDITREAAPHQVFKK